jgi:hypothetical protein
MMPTVLEIIARVRGVLAEQVLPELTATTWTAANIRSCIMLLTYIDDAIRLQPTVLTQANDALKDIIAAGLAADDGWLDPKIRQQIESLLADDTSSPCRPGSLEQENLQLKAAASNIIKCSAKSGHRDLAFQSLIRERLSFINKCESTIYENAAKLPPF